MTEMKKRPVKNGERQQTCFICNLPMESNQQGCIDTLTTFPSKMSISDKITIILGYPLPREAMNNIAICLKCYHLVNEVDVLEHRLNLCRKEVMYNLESSLERNGLPVAFYKKQQCQNNFSYFPHSDGQNFYCQSFLSQNHAAQAPYSVEQISLMSPFNYASYSDHNGQGFVNVTTGNSMGNDFQMMPVDGNYPIHHMQENHTVAHQQMIANSHVPINYAQPTQNNHNHNQSTQTSQQQSSHSNSNQTSHSNNPHTSHSQQLIPHSHNSHTTHQHISQPQQQSSTTQHISQSQQQSSNNPSHQQISDSSRRSNGESSHITPSSQIYPIQSSRTNIVNNLSHSQFITNINSQNSTVISNSIASHQTFMHPQVPSQSLCGPVDSQGFQNNAINYSNNKSFSQHNKNIIFPPDCSVLPSINKQSNLNNPQSIPQNLTRKHTEQSTESIANHYNTGKANLMPKDANISGNSMLNKPCKTDILCEGGVSNMTQNNTKNITMNNSRLSNSNQNSFTCNQAIHEIDKCNIASTVRCSENNIYLGCSNSVQENIVDVNMTCSTNIPSGASIPSGDSIFYGCNENKPPIPIHSFNDPNYAAMQYTLNPKNVAPLNNNNGIGGPSNQTCAANNNPRLTLEATDKNVEFPIQNRTSDNIINILSNEKRQDDLYNVPVSIDDNSLPNTNTSTCTNNNNTVISNIEKITYNTQYQSHSSVNNIVEPSYAHTVDITTGHNINSTSSSLKPESSEIIVGSIKKEDNINVKCDREISGVPHSQKEKTKDNLVDEVLIENLNIDEPEAILHDSFGSIGTGYSDSSRNFDESQHIFGNLSDYDEDINIEDITNKDVDDKGSKELGLDGNVENWHSNDFVNDDQLNSPDKVITDNDIDIEECDNLIEHNSNNDQPDDSSNSINTDDLLSLETNSPDNCSSITAESDRDNLLILPSQPPSPDPRGLERLLSPSSHPPSPTGPPEGLRTVQGATEYYKPTLLGTNYKMKKHAKLQICRQCDRVFSNRQTLIRHIDRRHKVYNHICTSCNKKFNSAKILLAHMEVHKMLECDLCGKKFRRKSILKKHLIQYHQKEYLTCNICGKSALSLQGLISHTRSHSKKKKVYKCDKCDKEFKGNTYLKDHMLIHSEELKFTCDNCKRCFRHKSNMVAHHKLCAGKSLFHCNICNKKFPLKSVYQKHVLTHSGQFDHQCSTCDKGFTKLTDLQRHFISHGKLTVPSFCKICKSTSSCNQPFSEDKIGSTCPICGKHLGRKHDLKDHISRHDNKRNYACDQCSLSFFYKGNLNNHIKFVHENVRKYICNVCNKSFAKGDGLKMHIRSHTGEKPFLCSCGKSFSCHGNLYKHRKLHKNDISNIPVSE